MLKNREPHEVSFKQEVDANFKIYSLKLERQKSPVRRKKESTMLNRKLSSPLPIDNFLRRDRRDAIIPADIAAVAEKINKTNNSVQHMLNDERQSTTVYQTTNSPFNPELEKSQNSKINKFKKSLLKILQSDFILFLLFIFTLYVLTEKDFLYIFNDPDNDIYFEVFDLIIFSLYLLEFIGSIMTKLRYLFSAHFWFDILAGISLVAELNRRLFYSDGVLVIDSGNLLDDFQRIQLRNSRIMIDIDIIRLVRIVKIYNVYVTFRKKKEIKKMKEFLKNKQAKIEEKTKKREQMKKKRSFQKSPKINILNKNNPSDTEEQIDDTNAKGSYYFSDTKRKSVFVESLFQIQNNKLGENEKEITFEKVNDRQINRVILQSIIVKVMIVILVTTLFSHLTDFPPEESFLAYNLISNIIDNHHTIYGINNYDYEEVLNYVIRNGTDPIFPIIKITHENYTIFLNNTFTTNYFRFEELGIISSPGNTTIIYSKYTILLINSILNIIRSIYSIFCLFALVILLEQDFKRIVLRPLEALIVMVEDVAKDPVNQKKIDKMQFQMSRYFKRVNSNKKKFENLQDAKYEMRIIQSSIVKISALLAIGFGEAGGEILRENLSSQQELNPMLDGRKITAIFGFCDIRHFKEINIALQEKTMIYVNKIAEIVHSSVHKFSGVANKNIGEAFLVAWKFPSPSKQSSFISQYNMNSFLADSALLGFLNVIKKIIKDPELQTYKYLPEIRQTFGNNFTTSMGFGLHVGWGIEGAIGSFYKIDCSYLSPNVNIAARLESATRQYGVPILISEILYDQLSSDLKKICRLIDRVALKGCKDPIKIYTVYINFNIRKSKMKSINKKQIMNTINDKKNVMFNTYAEFGSLGSLVDKKGLQELLRDERKPTFHQRFSEGYECYIQGDWKLAYQKLSEAVYLDEKDGPAKTLIYFIKKNNHKAPSDWNGYRELPK